MEESWVLFEKAVSPRFDPTAERHLVCSNVCWSHLLNWLARSKSLFECCARFAFYNVTQEWPFPSEIRLALAGLTLGSGEFGSSRQTASMVDAIASRRRAIAGDRFFSAQKNQIRILLTDAALAASLGPVYISVPATFHNR